jgi:hypothetical protein
MRRERYPATLLNPCLKTLKTLRIRRIPKIGMKMRSMMAIAVQTAMVAEEIWEEDCEEVVMMEGRGEAGGCTV